jgi:hypothetical protein
VLILVLLHCSMVDVGSDLEVEELRLIDEVFGKICNMINDLSLEVKVQAVKLLVRATRELAFQIKSRST